MQDPRHPLRPLRAAGARLPLALVAAAGLLLGAQAQDAAAQGGQTLRRASEIIGIPGMQIDLSIPAPRRYALVIGNGTYQHADPLPNAIADARLVAQVLRNSGYTVQERIDLDKRGFEAALRQLLTEAGKGAEVVIYFAGHGVQIGSSNRLIPVDAQIGSVYDLPFETVSLSSLLSIAGSRARSLVVILDSCRDNPFPGQGGIVGLDSVPQELRTGFSAQDTPVNSLIVFSTSPGARAFDGEGPNSPFTTALYEVATDAPDAPLDQVMRDVRRRVYEATAGLQVPWESSSLVETVSLNLDGDLAATAPASPQPAASRQAPIALSMPLGHEVNIGRALRDRIPAGDTPLRLASEPQLGRVELRDGPRYRGLTLVGIEPERIEELIYSSSRQESSARLLGGPSLTDSFDIASGEGVQTVQLTLDIDPCDFHAGDYLDPEGVGVARYPNEIEVAAALEACEAAVAHNPQTARFHYQLGRVHLAMSNLDAAEASFGRARDLGHTRAFTALGMLDIQRGHAQGGSTRAPASDRALGLLAMGVDRGDPYAFHSLGLQLLEHSEDQQRRRQGFDLMQRALELGHTFSMNALGLYFLRENTDHYEPLRGIRYLEESAARGDIYGYANMGFLRLNGVAGTPVNPQEALEWFRKAADEGHPTAPTSIGRMYFRASLGGKPDYEQAIRWYDQGLARGDGWGGANGAVVIVDHAPAGLGPADAGVRAAKAATLRNKAAADSAGQLLARLSPATIEAASDLLVRDIRAAIAARPAAAAAEARLLSVLAGTRPQDTARLKGLAEVFWSTQALRVDLY